MRCQIEPGERRYVKCYWIFSNARKSCDKCGKKLIDTASNWDCIKKSNKKAVGTTDDSIFNKTVIEIMSKSNKLNNNDKISEECDVIS